MVYHYRSAIQILIRDLTLDLASLSVSQDRLTHAHLLSDVPLPSFTLKVCHFVGFLLVPLSEIPQKNLNQSLIFRQ